MQENWYEKYQEEKQKEKGKLFSIRYKRDVKGTEHTTILTPDNCNEFGYTAKEYTYNNNDIIISGYVYQNNSTLEIADYEVDENSKTITTAIEAYNQVEYTHQAPACSDFKVSLADVHKEGSGRNDINGIMLIDRIGSYSQIEVTWNLIPNTEEYNNWYVVLSHLPPKFNIYALFPDGVKRDVEVYRGDVSTSLYWFLDENHQMWQGLSTTFIQANVDPYDDTYEPNVNDKQTVIRNYEVVLGEYNTDLKKKIFDLKNIYKVQNGEEPAFGIQGSSNDLLSISDKYSVFSDVYIKYVTCEPNYTILDNDFRFCDNINEIANNSGIITNEISNSSNEFSKQQSLSIYTRIPITPDNCAKYNFTYKEDVQTNYYRVGANYFYYSYATYNIYKNGFQQPNVVFKNRRIISAFHASIVYYYLVPYYYDEFDDRNWKFDETQEYSLNSGRWSGKNVNDYLNSLTEEKKNTAPIGFLFVATGEGQAPEFIHDKDEIADYYATKFEYWEQNFNYINDFINNGITITFYEVCPKFLVEFFDVNDNLIFSKQFENNKSLKVKISSSSLDYKSNVDKIIITIQKASKPNHRVRIKNIEFGVEEKIDDENLISLDIIRETDLYSNNNCSNEINIKINDKERKYDPKNSLKEEIAFGSNIKVFWVEKSNDEEKRYSLANENVYSSTYDYSSHQLLIQGNSIQYFASDNEYLSNFYVEISVESILNELFDFYGLYNNCILDNAFKDTKLTGYIPQLPFIDCITYICKAIKGYYYVNKNGDLIIEPLKKENIITNISQNDISSFNIEKQFNEIEYIDIASYYYIIPEEPSDVDNISSLVIVFEGKVNKGINYIKFNQVVKSYNRSWVLFNDKRFWEPAFSQSGLKLISLFSNGAIIQSDKSQSLTVKGLPIQENKCFYRFYKDLSFDILENGDNSKNLFDNKFINVDDYGFGNEEGAKSLLRDKLPQYLFSNSNYTYDLSTKFDHKFELGDKKIVHTEFGEDVITINKIEIDGSLIEKIGGK